MIGAGLGGLAAALRLRALGVKVTVCDNGPAPGGKANRWRAGPYCFDTGPTLLTMPEVLRRLFSDLGEELERHLELAPLDPRAEYLYPDGFRVRVPAPWSQWVEVVRSLEPRELPGLQRVHDLGARIFRVSQETFFRERPLASLQWPPLGALRHLPLRHAWGNYARVVESLLCCDRLRRIYLRYPTYVGSSPCLCPAALLIIPYLEHACGVWKVRGGIYRIVEALVKLARGRGVELFANTRVVGIEHRQGRVRAVRLSTGDSIEAEVVVYNGDSAALPPLLGAPVDAPTRRRSLSGVVILLGLRERIEGLELHTVFFSADYRKEFDELFRLRRFPEDPTVYVSAPDEPELAPPGGQSLFIMANAPGDPGFA
ncbi:MAG: phytoene desaturase family protein [Bryobacteraceae bacterium]